jgi:hypothetical protein
MPLGKASDGAIFINVIAGSAATWPLTAHDPRGQQTPKLPLIGYLVVQSEAAVPKERYLVTHAMSQPNLSDGGRTTALEGSRPSI